MDGRQFKSYPEQDSEAKFEQICCPMFEGMTQAKHKLDVDNNFK